MLIQLPTDKTVSEAVSAKPTTLLAMSNTPQLERVSQEVEYTMVKIIKEAAASG